MATRIIIMLFCCGMLFSCLDQQIIGDDPLAHCNTTDSIYTTEWSSMLDIPGEEKLTFKSSSDLIVQLLQTRVMDTITWEERWISADSCLKIQGQRISSKCVLPSNEGYFKYDLTGSSSGTILHFEQFNEKDYDSLIVDVNLKTGKTINNYYKWDWQDKDWGRTSIYLLHRDSIEIGGKMFYDILYLYNFDFNTSPFPKRTIIGLMFDRRIGLVLFRTNDTEWWHLQP